MTETPAHHTAEHWASMPRRVQGFSVTKVEDSGDSLTISGDHGWTFMRSKAELGRDITVGEDLWVETVKFGQITGLQDANGWLFRLTDEDLARQARELSEQLRRSDVVQLEKNRQLYAEWEAALPNWLKARIQRFRDAAGEKFLLKGWGYELVICRLAALLDVGDEEAAESLARQEGVTGNQWDCARTLAEGRARHGDRFAVECPGGLSPITGSADYS